MKIQLFIVAEYDRYQKHYNYCAWPCKPWDDKILIEEREIEFDAPPESALIAGTVEAYRAEQQKIRAEMQAKVNALQQSIDEMLSITYQPDLKSVA